MYSSDGLIKNVVFIPAEGPDKPIMPENLFLNSAGDYTVETYVRSGFDLVGFKSISKNWAEINNKVLINRLDFIFRDRTDVRCQVPSQALVRNITALFLDSD